MFSCYVIDDESHAINVLKNHIEKTDSLHLIGTCCNPLEGLHYFMEKGYPDITFLDIDMPQLSGLELSSLIGQKTTVVFTTAFRGYALDAFEKDAFDYLIKPISYDRFLKSIVKLTSRIKLQPSIESTAQSPLPYFFIQTESKGKMTRIYYEEVLFIESLKNYVRIETTQGKYITYLSLKDVEDQIRHPAFVRVHKSYIVNLSKVESIQGNELLMQEKTKILIGASYKEAFFSKINLNLLKTKRLHH